MSLATDLERELQNVPKVDPHKNYWIIRTFGGALYEEFLENDYVAFGLNTIPLTLIKQTARDYDSLISRLRSSIESNTNYKGGVATRYANQLIDFCVTAKQGDIVLIPNHNSDEYSIGRIEDDEAYQTDDNRTFEHKDSRLSYPHKRRRIVWIKQVNRSTFKTDMLNSHLSHAGISRVNFLRDTIESQLSSFYIIEDDGYFSINIRQDEAINAFDLARFLNSITYFYDELCEELGIELNEDLYIKIRVQSKGKINLTGTALIALAGLGVLFALQDNPTIKADLGKYGNYEGTGAGLLQSFSNFLDRKQERELRAKEFTLSKEKVEADIHEDQIETDSTDTDSIN